jgi:hypothetical protein
MEAARRPPAFKENQMATMFVANEGGLDRAMRVIVGLVLLSLMFVGPKSMWGLVGAVPLLTGLAGTCPLYSLLGLSTHSNKAR